MGILKQVRVLFADGAVCESFLGCVHSSGADHDQEHFKPLECLHKKNGRDERI